MWTDCYFMGKHSVRLSCVSIKHDRPCPALGSCREHCWLLLWRSKQDKKTLLGFQQEDFQAGFEVFWITLVREVLYQCCW